MITITKYHDIENYITAFATGNIRLLLIEGSGGTGKTVTTTKTLEHNNTKHKVIAGHITPLDFYKTLYAHRDGYVFVLDDIDSLLKNPIHTSLLKQLCDTKDRKVIQYHTTSGRMDDVPKQFVIHSSVVIIVNSISYASNDIKALLTRGVHIFFNPTNQEMIQRAKEKLRVHKTIIDYISNQEKIITTIDLRKIILANNLIGSSIDWKEWLRQELNINQDYEVVIKINNDYDSYKDRVREFRKQTGKSEATYNRYVKEIMA